MNDPLLSPAWRRLRNLARIATLVWVALWLTFAILSRLGEPATVEGMTSLAIRGGGLVVLALAAWFAPNIGGWLLVLVGVLALGGGFRFSQNPLLLVRVILGGPPIGLGVLLLLASGRSQRGPPSTG